MEKIEIKNINKVKYSGYVYNLELEGKEDKDDLYWVEQDTGIVTHNCLPKDMDSMSKIFKEKDLHSEFLHLVSKVNKEYEEKAEEE